jgi:hypothetical protein
VDGPDDNLLDTRGMIHLSLNQPEQAIKDLEEAVARGADAVRCFHLAQAFLAIKNRGAATRFWLRAQEHGLKPADLHPLDLPAYQRLKETLEEKGKS